MMHTCVVRNNFSRRRAVEGTIRLLSCSSVPGADAFVGPISPLQIDVYGTNRAMPATSHCSKAFVERMQSRSKPLP